MYMQTTFEIHDQVQINRPTTNLLLMTYSAFEAELREEKTEMRQESHKYFWGAQFKGEEGLLYTHQHVDQTCHTHSLLHPMKDYEKRRKMVSPFQK